MPAWTAGARPHAPPAAAHSRGSGPTPPWRAVPARRRPIRTCRAAGARSPRSNLMCRSPRAPRSRGRHRSGRVHRSRGRGRGPRSRLPSGFSPRTARDRVEGLHCASLATWDGLRSRRCSIRASAVDAGPPAGRVSVSAKWADGVGFTLHRSSCLPRLVLAMNRDRLTIQSLAGRAIKHGASPNSPFGASWP